MKLHFTCVREDLPGPKWTRLFETFWDAYRFWFISQGQAIRPTLQDSQRALRRWMPELMPIYERLVALTQDELVARFLCLYCPPPYLSACTQAVWPGPPSVLVRNYDFGLRWFEGVLLHTNWNQRVIAMSDCLWGVLDGMNESGLALSLTFGGRKTVGNGFGIPLILRYILETCNDSQSAARVLQQVPSHMAYNVTMTDAQGTTLTIWVSPDRQTMVTSEPIGVNHQASAEWKAYEQRTSSVARKTFLRQRLDQPGTTLEGLVKHFLEPPLYHTDYEKGFGTLYTAVYTPRERKVEYLWPQHPPLQQSFHAFSEIGKSIELGPR